MSLPWLTQPVSLHSSRDPGSCSLTSEQCAYKSRYWVFWYEADHRFGLPTVAFFMVAIILFGIAHFMSIYMPGRLKSSRAWLRLVAATRFLSYKSWRIRGWNTESLGTFALGAAGAVFFLAMTLGPHPYYWPNTRTLSFGNSPPIATRTGYMALGCLPFVIILGAKANPITALTGVSYERLNIWHNWASWAMFVLALIHTFPFIVFHIWKGDIVAEWKDGGVWVTGAIAIIAQAWLTFMSIPWIRNRYYEFFKATHFLAAAVFVIFFFLHCDFRLTSWDYFIATGVLYSLSWTYAQCRTYIEHGPYRKARLSLASDQSLRIVITTNVTWTPGQHVFLRFLTMGIHALTAHPFTISSIPRPGKDDNQMVFYIEPRGGLTGRMAQLAEKQPNVAIPVLLDGPYGGVPGRWFSGFDKHLVVAGGAGAGFTLSLIEHFLVSRASNINTAELTVVIATRDLRMREWYVEALEELAESVCNANMKPSISIHIHETSTTTLIVASDETKSESSEAGDDKERAHSSLADGNVAVTKTFGVEFYKGRPDLKTAVRELVNQRGVSLGIVVCGPSSMVHDIGEAATMAQKGIIAGKEQGASEVWFHHETFT